MIFKVPALREEIGDPLDIYIYSFNSDISSMQPLFFKGGKKMRLLLLGEKDCELYLESCELVGGQIMR